MPDSMWEMLRNDVKCEGLLECFHGLKQLARTIFRVLADGPEPRTIDEITAAVERSRSTAYRPVRRLVRTGFVRKEQVNYD